MKFKVKPTSVADGLPAGVTSPQRGGARLAVGTLRPCPLTHNLQKVKREENRKI